MAKQSTIRNTELVNQEYYQQLYHYNHPIFHLVHAAVSFDQKSKSRANHAMSAAVIQAVTQTQKIKVLDYGCGWGVFLLNMPSARSELYCFDISSNVVRSLQAVMAFIGRSVKVVESHNQKLSPNDFDLIVCSHVLEHVESDEFLLQQFVDALQPNGYLLLNVPINEVWVDYKHVRTYTPESLAQKLADIGIKIVNACEVDRWSSFILQHELQHQQRSIRLLFKLLRGILAVLPYGLVQLCENLVPKHHLPQQLVVLGIKL